MLRARLPRFQRLAAFPVVLQRRGVASSVGIKPGSESFAHATQNIREEAGNSVRDLARAIAGANLYVQDKAKDGFVGLTRVMASEVPTPVLAFGLVGGLPYLGTGATTVYLAHQAGLANIGSPFVHIDPGIATNILTDALSVQVTYGAVVLSFLGALHWGMEFAEFGGRKGWRRLALGAAPILVAWPTLAFDPTLALCGQWAAFTALWYADLKATGAGWAPRWYAQYRFYLSILAGSCILGTLAGITYWGPVGGHGLLSHELYLVREARRALYEAHPETNFGTELVLVKGDDEGRFFRLRKREDVEREELEKSKREGRSNKQE
uniref:Mnn4-regulates the mannosylphosphorylation n=1 Tax=Mycena chlorophos TaxID=658473 RepID=A0ABQ0LKU3_MYCCL|nr:predicted protein [Mycena chlorophos]